MGRTSKGTTAARRDDEYRASHSPVARVLARCGRVALAVCALTGCVSDKEHRQLQTRCATVEAERDRLTQEVATLRSDWQKLTDTDATAALVAQLRAALAESRAKCAEAEQRASQSLAEAQAVRAERDALRASAQSVQQAKTEAERQLQQCQALLANALRGPEYPAVGDGHWVREKIGRGEYIILEDGSLWEISRLDRIDTALWLTTESIVVLENSSGLLPYKLINTDTEDVVEAKYLGTR